MRVAHRNEFGTPDQPSRVLNPSKGFACPVSTFRAHVAMPDALQLANLAPPFAEGNTAAVTHGIYSEEGRAAVEKVVAPYLDAVIARAPWVASEAFAAEQQPGHSRRQRQRQRPGVSIWRKSGLRMAKAGCGRRAKPCTGRRSGKLRNNLGLSPMAHARLIGVPYDRTDRSTGGVPRTPETEAELEKVIQAISEGRRLMGGTA